jgi:photosystem II stability/assembly factor-like uncharacterized protein
VTAATVLVAAATLLPLPELRVVPVDARSDGQASAAANPADGALHARRRIWEKPGGGMTFALAVDPSRPRTVYAGTGRGGIFVSTDGGRRWRRLMFSWRAGRILALAVDRDGRVYAGREDGRIIRSTDRGDTWTVIYRGAAGVEINGIALDRRTTPMVVYAGTSAGAVLRSSDAGETWSPNGVGLDGQSVAVVAVDPRRRAGVVWAGTKGGMFRSRDGGAHWRKINPQSVRELALDPTRRQTLFGTNEGVLRSVDGAQTWKRIGGTRYALSLVVDTRTMPGAVYVGTSYESVLRSADGGDSWSPASAGLSRLGEVVELAIDTRTEPSTLYAASSHVGVYRSIDGGTSWQVDEGEVLP